MCKGDLSDKWRDACVCVCVCVFCHMVDVCYTSIKVRYRDDYAGFVNCDEAIC
jgi:hypothetical protein